MDSVQKNILTDVQHSELLTVDGGFAVAPSVWLTVKTIELATYLYDRFVGQQAANEPKGTSTSDDTGADSETPSP
jgi:hypothetical protein